MCPQTLSWMNSLSPSTPTCGNRVSPPLPRKRREQRCQTGGASGISSPRRGVKAPSVLIWDSFHSWYKENPTFSTSPALGAGHTTKPSRMRNKHGFGGVCGVLSSPRPSAHAQGQGGDSGYRQGLQGCAMCWWGQRQSQTGTLPQGVKTPEAG